MRLSMPGTRLRGVTARKDLGVPGCFSNLSPKVGARFHLSKGETTPVGLAAGPAIPPFERPTGAQEVSPPACPSQGVSPLTWPFTVIPAQAGIQQGT